MQGTSMELRTDYQLRPTLQQPEETLQGRGLGKGKGFGGRCKGKGYHGDSGGGGQSKGGRGGYHQGMGRGSLMGGTGHGKGW